MVSFISWSAGLLGGGRGLWTRCRLWLSGRCFSWFLLCCLRSFFLCLCLLGLWLFVYSLLGPFLSRICWFLFSGRFLWCRRFLFFSWCFSCSPLLWLLLGLLKRKATELERGFLEREALFLLLAILTGGWSALLWLGGSLSIIGNRFLLTVGFSTFYILTTFLRCLLSGSITIDLDFSLVGICCSRRGISVGCSMAVLLRKNVNIFLYLALTIQSKHWTDLKHRQTLWNNTLHFNMLTD